jgi:hypothetical protein
MPPARNQAGGDTAAMGRKRAVLERLLRQYGRFRRPEPIPRQVRRAARKVMLRFAARRTPRLGRWKTE